MTALSSRCGWADSETIELLATEEPYLIPAGDSASCHSHVVRAIPSRHAIDAARKALRLVPVLRWHGSLASSRLLLTEGDAELAGGAVALELRGESVYYARRTTDDDVGHAHATESRSQVLRRFSWTKHVFIVRRSAPEHTTTLLLFPGAADVASFARDPHSRSSRDSGADLPRRDAWPRAEPHRRQSVGRAIRRRLVSDGARERRPGSPSSCTRLTRIFDRRGGGSRCAPRLWRSAPRAAAPAQGATSRCRTRSWLRTKRASWRALLDRIEAELKADYETLLGGLAD